MTHGCATKRGPKCSGTSPQPGALRFEICFPGARGNTQPLCSLADKGFSLGCHGQGKQGEIQFLGLLLSQCSHSPMHNFHPWSHRAGLAQPQLCPAPQNTQPHWKERGEVYSDCGGVGSEAKRDGKVRMPADFNGKKSWLSSLSPAGGCSRLSAELESSSPAQSSLNRALHPEDTEVHPALGAR